MKTEDLITAETARRAKLAEAARRRPREKGRFVANEPDVVFQAETYEQFMARAVREAKENPNAQISSGPISIPSFWTDPAPPPMRHETNGFTGLHTDTDAPRPWRLTAAWVLLGAAIGWLACVVVGSL